MEKDVGNVSPGRLRGSAAVDAAQGVMPLPGLR
jgi:hypothetical protein